MTQQEIIDTGVIHGLMEIVLAQVTQSFSTGEGTLIDIADIGENNEHVYFGIYVSEDGTQVTVVELADDDFNQVPAATSQIVTFVTNNDVIDYHIYNENAEHLGKYAVEVLHVLGVIQFTGDLIK